MLQTWVVVPVGLAYIGILFAIARYGDMRADQGRSIIANPYIYALSLGVYATAWTFYGSVGRAAGDGVGFLPIYIGPTLMMALWWIVLRKIVRISKTNRITSLAFDRWRINDFKRAAERCGFATEAQWCEVGQGFKDMSPRIESFETAVLRGRVRHGSHPVLNMGASCAVVVTDPTGGRKLDKTRATQRIDALVAAIMASHESLVGVQDAVDVTHWIA